MTILATIIVLGVLIFVHELGHFVAAKAVGIEVQRFSIGLGPKVAGYRRGETEYVLSAIPLGGYVKMRGMGDDEVTGRLEGGADAEPRQPSDRDFDAKPIWARTIVISAGVVMNMVFAFAAYTGSVAVWGSRELATTRVAAVRATALPPGTETLAELPSGASIERIGGRTVEDWGDVRDGFVEAAPGPATVFYAGPQGSLELRIPLDPVERRRVAAALDYWVEPEAGAVEPGTPAERAGIEAGDRFLAVGGERVVTWWDFRDAVESRPGQRTEFLILRDGREITRVATPDSEEVSDPVTGETSVLGRVGIWPPYDDVVYERVPLSAAVVQGAQQTWAVTAMILQFLGDLVTGNVSPRSVGSIVTIGSASGQAAALGLEAFLRFMALFSINLAVLNLLPIPILDGGHLLFLAIEKVRGRALTIEQRLRWSNVGLLIVMGLMVWALSNDVLRLLGL